MLGFEKFSISSSHENNNSVAQKMLRPDTQQPSKHILPTIIMFINRSCTDLHRRGGLRTLYIRVTRHNSETAKNGDFGQVGKLNKVK